ncbi:MAG: DedA family protein [Rhodanobacteraceae bacterium]
MRLFRPLYERAMVWASHPHANIYLALLSFVEAFIFPVMPEVMLAPMTLAKPKQWVRLATLSLCFSLLGSLVGYFLGHYAYQLIEPLLSVHMQAVIGQWVATLRDDMHAHWLALLGALLLAALQPVIPMKFVTWASGIVGVPILPFLACMALGRGKRVYLLTGAIRLGGRRAEVAIHKYIEWIGWAIAVLIVLLLVWWWAR